MRLDSSIPAVPALQRRSFLRRSLTAIAGVTGGAALLSAPREASAVSGQFKADRRNFVAITKHENDHVDFLVNALGANARPKPTFRKLEQNTLKHFFEAAVILENTGVGAYLGAAPSIDDPANLAAAGTIAFIEGRHAGWLNARFGYPITGTVLDLDTDHSFDEPLTPDEVDQLASAFISSLNGGPPVTYSLTPSPTNDIAILNFALALEYLEADFYNINTPKFFG